MKRFLVTELDLRNIADSWRNKGGRMLQVALSKEIPPNARMLTLEAILSANAKNGGGPPTVGFMRALEELFGEDDK